MPGGFARTSPLTNAPCGQLTSLAVPSETPDTHADCGQAHLAYAVPPLWREADRCLGPNPHARSLCFQANGSARALDEGSPAAEAESRAARDAILASNPNMAGFLAAESTALFAVAVCEWGFVEGYVKALTRPFSFFGAGGTVLLPVSVSKPARTA